MFVVMGLFWITASCFLILPFYIFKKQPFFQCEQFDQLCVDRICRIYKDHIKDHLRADQSLTYFFGLYCGKQWIRVLYKICPESLSWIGLLAYGYIADRKGRKLAFKISWRFYAIGLVLFTSTETQFLISFGYVLACLNCFPSLVIQFVLLFQQTDRKHRFKACLLLLSFLLVGPLFGSFFAGRLMEVSFKITLLVLCTVPAIILCFLTQFLEESAVFTYKDNKMQAFSLINRIAKINKIPPILIDFGKSKWLHYTDYFFTYVELLTHKPTRRDCLIGFSFILTFTFNARLAQKSLDEFTSSEERGALMNGATAVATVTLIFFLSKFDVGKYNPYISLLSLLVLLIALILKEFAWSNETSQIILSVALRYLANLSYGIFLIWAIQAFPTVCRAKCLSFVLCGGSFAAIAVYGFTTNQTILLAVGILLNFLVLLSIRSLFSRRTGRLGDTLRGGYYDENDRFYRLE